MKGFDVLRVKSASKAINKFDLSRSHLTTMDFGQIVPLCVIETVPGDKFDIGADYFSRMAPLVKPTYGKFEFKTVTGFVPYHQIAYDADAFFAGKSTFEGVTPRQRYFTKQGLFDFVWTYCTTGTGATALNSDFTYIGANGSTVYRVFTPVGKYYVKILNALGYALPQGVDDQTGSYWKTTDSLVKLSAYPLLAFFKMYNDYMSQSQRFNISALSSFLLSVKNGVAVTGYTPSTGLLAYNAINTLFSNLYLNYDNDYFTSAWQSPNNPLSSPDSLTGSNVPGYSTMAANQTAVDTQLTFTASNPFTLGQRALDFLKDFDDWVRRNNYSGSRSVQQIYSRFGIKTDDYRSHYAHIYSTDSMPIQVGDVTATADASNVPLGDYAGKGIMSGSKGVTIEVSDYGLVIILGYFTVIPMNPYGFDRMVLRTHPLDYYNPEFDGIGADAITLSEYFESPIAVGDGDTTHSNDVFGFTERYNSYRFGRDVITGEFRNYRNNADMNTWHTGRNMSAIRQAGNLVAQSSSVNTLEQTGSQYNRIFSVTSDGFDHFYLTAHFDVSAIRKMLNLNQVVRLGEGDTVVPRNGNVIS